MDLRYASQSTQAKGATAVQPDQTPQPSISPALQQQPIVAGVPSSGGSVHSSQSSLFWKPKQKHTKAHTPPTSSNMCTCLFVGLEGSGKTTIVNSLIREIFRPMRIEDIMAKNVKVWKPGSVNPFSTKTTTDILLTSPSGMAFKFIDTPNVFSHRSSWREWFMNDINSVIFVIDFNDRIRVPLARQMLHEVALFARPGTHMIIVATRQERHPTINTIEGIRSFLDTNSLPIASSVVLVTSDRSSIQNDTNSCAELLKWIITAMKLKSSPMEAADGHTRTLGTQLQVYVPVSFIYLNQYEKKIYAAVHISLF